MPSRVAGRSHCTPSSARVARGPRARAKNSAQRERRFLAVTLVGRPLTLGWSHSLDLSHSPIQRGNCRNPTKPPSPLRGHPRPRLAIREGVLVAHPRPAAQKIPPCTPNEFFAKQLPITPPPEDILGHIAWQLPLIWAPAASHTPSRSPSKAHRLAAIWRKPAKKRTTQIALRRARRGGSIIRGTADLPPTPPAAFPPSTTFPSDKSRARPCG